MALSLLLLLLPIATQTLNLAEKNPQVLSGPNGSYFGFSLDFYQSADQKMNVVVGAPRMQTSQPGVQMGGGVFLCPWKSKSTSCTHIEFDQTGDYSGSDDTIKMNILKSNQWFGATVRTWNSSIVVCAPFQQWNVIQDMKESGNTPTGACYVTSDLQDIREFAPCRESNTADFYNNNLYLPDNRYCELGFSADINKDGTLLAGAPGGFYFKGLYATVKLSNIRKIYSASSLIQMHPDQHVYLDYRSPYDAYKGFSVAFGEFLDDKTPELVIGSPTYMDKGVVASYFGHSVAVVDINNDGMDDVLVGAPLYIERRTGGKLLEVGRVYVYMQRRANKFTSDHPVLSGSRVYGQFGSSIAPLGDLDQDGYNDVAVGSPYGGRSGGGCVNIYMGTKSGLSPQASQVLESPLPPPSRFGFALRGGTDLDGNGYPDLLVGAFEADKVYIFRAQPVVLLQPSLYFHPEALNPDLKLCKLPDTGAAGSCFIVIVCAQTTRQNRQKKLTLQVDLQLDRLKTRFSRRTFFLDSSQPSKTFSMELQSHLDLSCHNHTAYLRGESEFKDKLSPIAVSVNFSIASIPSNGDVQPTLQGTTYLQGQIHILLDCGEDNVCIPDLHLSASWPTEPLLIGIDNLMLIHFNATNTGEGAYEAELHVWLPTGAHYMQVLGETEEKIHCSPKKENETELLVCDLGNPMKNGAEIHADLQLSFSKLEDSGSTVTFPMQIKSRNSQNSSSPVFLVQLPVKVTASLELRGSSHPDNLILPLPNWEPKEESRKPQDYGEEVTHVYELHNAGPGSVRVQFVLQSPDQYQGDYLLYPLRLETDDKTSCYNHSFLNPLELDIITVTQAPINYSKIADHRLDKRDVERGMTDGWTVEGENNTETEELIKKNHPILLNCSGSPCWEVQCFIQSLDRGQRATVKLHSILWIPSFLKRPLQQFTLRSRGFFQVTGAPYRIQPTTLLAGEETADTQVQWVSPDGQKEIPLWWIIVGVLGGLLILALFIVIMWKLGFFQRTRPPSDDQEELSNDQ
ncbi:integrin alpha-IIb [Rhinophrynus dorsalis]